MIEAKDLMGILNKACLDIEVLKHRIVKIEISKDTLMLNKKMFKVKKLFSYLSTACFVTVSGSACAFYDAYPESEGPYTSAPASEKMPWSGENFEPYQDAQLLECANDKAAILHFDITSGCLASKSSGSWKYGWTDDKVFRVVAIATDNLRREVKYTQQTNQYRAKINRWKNAETIPAWSGLHAFTRYQSSDDLYVASIRYDGYATIKVKYQGSYRTLAQTKLNNTTKNYLDENGHLAAGQWYKINFSAIGETLTLSLDGVELLAVNNDLLSEGTIGIRTDYVETYLDDWQLTESEKVILPPVTPSMAPKATPPPVMPDSLSIAEFVPGKSKINNGESISYNGACYQAQNSPGIWEIPSNNSWFWETVSCVDAPQIRPTANEPTVTSATSLNPVLATQFVLGTSKVKNGETVIFKGDCYQAKNNPDGWEVPRANS